MSTKRTQPKICEITKKLKEVLNGNLSREALYQWGMSYITDLYLDIEDLVAFRYLQTAVNVDAIIPSGEYLYIDVDIKSWIKEYDPENADF